MYELSGLVAVPLPNDQTPLWEVPIMGDVGLGGRMYSDDLSAFTAVEGGEKCVELGLEGEARGTISLGSGAPE